MDKDGESSESAIFIPDKEAEKSCLLDSSANCSVEKDSNNIFVKIVRNGELSNNVESTTEVQSLLNDNIVDLRNSSTKYSEQSNCDEQQRQSGQIERVFSTPDTCSPYIKNLTLGSSLDSEGKAKINIEDEENQIPACNDYSNFRSTVVNIDDDCDNDTKTYSDDKTIPTSSSFLIDKSSLSGKAPTTSSPSGSCLRSGSSSKGGCSNYSGVHVQFETPTHSQDNVFRENEFYIGDGTGKEELGEVTSYLIKVHPERGTNYEGGALSGKKKKKKRHVSGESSNNSMGSSNSVLSESSGELQRKAPDGGWGWVVVIASFFVHCIADGVTMSFGVLFIELLNHFKESKSFTSLVGSLYMSIPLLAGPIASVLTDHYGCRTVTIVGSIIAFIGFFLSAFADSMYFLLLTLGLITGLGLAVCYVAAIVIVAFYFEKKRSLATGIAVAGSGIGTFVFAPLLQYLISVYGWRGCLIIISGVFLNLCVCGAVMRDLEWTTKKRSHEKTVSTSLPISRPNSSSQSVDSLNDTPAPTSTQTPTVLELRKILETGDVSVLLSPDEPHSRYARSNSVLTIPTFINRTKTLPPDILPCLNTKGNAFEIVSKVYPHLIKTSFSEQAEVLPMLSDTRLHKIAVDNTIKGLDREKLGFDSQHKSNVVIDTSTQDTTIVYKEANREEQSNDEDDHKVTVSEDDACPLKTKKVSESLMPNAQNSSDCNQQHVTLPATHPLTSLKQNIRKRISSTNLLSPNFLATNTKNPLLSSSGAVLPPYSAAPLRNMRINKQSMTYRGAMLNIHRYRLRASSCPDIYRNSMITIDEVDEEPWNSCLNDITEDFRSCLRMPFFQHPGFLVFCLSNFILYFFYDTVYMYLVDYAHENGVSDDDSANLISIIGLLNCIGMVSMGYIGDKSWSPLLLIYNISMVLCGLSVVVMPFVTGYRVLMLLSGFFGFFISANYALTSVILVELISLDYFTKAYGILLLIQGMANLLGPPLVGYMRDSSADYMVPFVVSGIGIIVCGLMLFIIPLISEDKDSSSSGSSSSSSSSAIRQLTSIASQIANQPNHLITLAANHHSNNASEHVDTGADAAGNSI